MKIAIVGIGHVGLSLAIVLSKKNEVWALDIAKEKVDLINSNKSPIKDKETQEFLEKNKLNLHATTDYKKAFEEGFNSWYKSYFASYLNTTEHLEELEKMMAEYAMKSAIAFDMSDEPVSRLADF